MGQTAASIKERLRDRPVVAIVGGGYSGIAAAKALDEQFNVLLFDRKNYFFHNIGALRSCVNSQDVKNIVIPYDNLLKYGVVIQAEVKKITDKNLIVQGLDEPVPFNYLIIATGSSYAFPSKIASPDASGVSKFYEETAQSIKEASNILIIGGGPVGLELLGEIAVVYPDKKIVVIQSNEKIIVQSIKDEFRETVLDRIKTSFPNVTLRTGEKIILDDEMKQSQNSRYLKGKRSVKTSKNETIETDLIFFCTGAFVNSRSYEETFANHLNEEKRIKVKPTLQLEGYENIFAIGDCAAITVKMAFYGGMEAGIAAHNIIKVHQNQKNQLKEFVKPNADAMILSLGTNQGASQLPFGGGKVFGAKVTQGIKGDLLVRSYWKQLGYQNPPNQLMLPKNKKNVSKDDEKEEPNHEINSGPIKENFSRISIVMGSTAKMSPEQFQKLFEGLEVDEVKPDQTNT